MSKYYVATVRNNAEWHVHSKLRLAGFESWFPFYIADALYGHWRIGKVRAHVAGYLFIAVKRNAHNFAKNTEGVIDIIRDGDNPAIVPESVLEQLRRIFEPYQHSAFCQAVKPVMVELGGQVRLTDGPFIGFIGTVASIIGPDEVNVWLDLMHRKVPVKVKAVDLEPVLPARALSA